MNIYLVNILTFVVAILFGYLLGAIPFGIVIGKVFFHKDIRDYGSGNSGGTNAGRVLGKKIGLLVIILDMLKTVAAIMVVWAVLTFTSLHSYYEFAENPLIFQDLKPLYYWAAGLFAAIGHCWPVYIKFKGGKAAACLMGMTTMVSWGGFIAGLFYLVALKLKKMVSLSSILSGLAQTLFAWIMFALVIGLNLNPSFFAWTFGLGSQGIAISFWYAICVTIVSVLLVARHHANIARMKEGKESKITWMK
jgi:glycerol-3-phosphate acyltransferase PlsY